MALWRKKKKKQRHQYDVRNGGFLKLGVFFFMLYVLVFDFFKVKMGEDGISVSQRDIVKGSAGVNEKIPDIGDVKNAEYASSGLSFVTVQKGDGTGVSWCGSKLFLKMKAVSLKGEVIEDTGDSTKIITIGDGGVDVQLEKNLFDMKKGEVREIIIDSVPEGAGLVRSKIAYNVELVDMEKPLKRNSNKLFKYIREEEGEGASPYCGDKLSVKYKSFSGKGELIEERVLDVAIGEGIMPKVIESQLMQMNIGERGTIFIPAGGIGSYQGDMKANKDDGMIVEIEIAKIINK